MNLETTYSKSHAGLNQVRLTGWVVIPRIPVVALPTPTTTSRRGASSATAAAASTAYCQVSLRAAASGIEEPMIAPAAARAAPARNAITRSSTSSRPKRAAPNRTRSLVTRSQSTLRVVQAGLLR